MAASSIFGKRLLVQMEKRVPSVVAGAPKWFHPRRNFSVGDTVIIADEQMPRNLWPIG